MIQLLTSAASDQLQNVYTPLPLNVHFIFCLIATLLYLLQYYRKGAVHYLVLMAAVDATIVTQFWTTPAAIAVLAVAEVVLLAAYGVMSFRYNKAQKLLNAEKTAQAEQEEKRAAEAEKTQQKKDADIVGNAFDDK